MGACEAEHFRLKWNDFQASMTSAFSDIRNEQDLFDLTLVTPGGRVVEAHKLVVSACSTMFRGMLRHASASHSVVFLHGIEFNVLNAILNFMYDGEVSVDQENLDTFLSAAESLQIRGLTQYDMKNDRNLDDFLSQSSSSKRLKVTIGGEDHGEDEDELGICGTVNDAEENVKLEPTSYEDSEKVSTLNRRVPSVTVTKGLGKVANSSPKDFSYFGTPKRGRKPSVLPDYSTKEGVSYHKMGGRDSNDPMSAVTVALSCRGWHCPDCSHTSTTKGNLKAHILSGRHKPSEKAFTCQFCQRSYSTRQSLQVHISTHHRVRRDQQLYGVEATERQQNEGDPGTSSAAPSATATDSLPSSPPTQQVSAKAKSFLQSPSVQPASTSSGLQAPHQLISSQVSAGSGGASLVPTHPQLALQHQYMHYIQGGGGPVAAAFQKPDSDLASNYGGLVRNHPG